MDGHVLWPFLFRASHDFAEPGFCLLQLPLRGPWSAWPVLSCCGRRSLSETGHADQITTCGQKGAGKRGCRLLSLESYQRVDSRRSPCRQVGGDECDQGEAEGRKRDGQRIGCPQAKEKAGDLARRQARCRERRSDTGGQADDHQHHRFAEDDGRSVT